MDDSLLLMYNDLTILATKLHDNMETALSVTTPEEVAEEEKKRRENNIKMRECVYKIDLEMNKLDTLKKVIRIKQSWGGSDLKILEGRKFKLLRDIKNNNVDSHLPQ